MEKVGRDMNRLSAGAGFGASAITMARTCLVLFCILPPVVPVHAQAQAHAHADDDDDVPASLGRITWKGTTEESSHSGEYKDIKNYTDRPDEQTIKALSVEWQKPELDALSIICTIRGQLKMRQRGAVGKSAVPATWFQGVTVYMARAPGEQPDWSKGMNSADTEGATVVVSPSGKFHVRFDLRDTKYRKGRAQTFQFGLALAQHTIHSKTSQNVVWSTRAPAIPATVQMLVIPAGRELSRELELLNNASRWPFGDRNGANLIRAVNALRLLGKERALAVLEEYAAISRKFDDYREWDVVFSVVRLLFEPIRLGDRIPVPGVAVHLVQRDSPKALAWPLNPMTVSRDVPFMAGHQINRGGGMPEDPAVHIRWARLHGVIRDDPLIPKSNPLAAAEAILDGESFKALDNFTRNEVTKAVRSQAVAMVEGLLQTVRAPEDVDDDQWKAALKAAADRGIRWDVKREQFVVGE
jgi:hypothetical protein